MRSHQNRKEAEVDFTRETRRSNLRGNTVAKKQAGREDVDSDYLFVNSSQRNRWPTQPRFRSEFGLDSSEMIGPGNGMREYDHPGKSPHHSGRLSCLVHQSGRSVPQGVEAQRLPSASP